MQKILGMENAYKEAIEKPGENVLISANLVKDMVERIGGLEDALTDFKESSETCCKFSNWVLERHKDL